MQRSIGDDKIRAATSVDIQESVAYLKQLIELLPNLKAIVLVGGKAQEGIKNVQVDTKIKIFKALHPSQRVLNVNSEADDRIIGVFKEVAAYIKSL